MRPPYSTRFAYAFLDANTVSYTVPAGMTAIIACVDWTITAASGGNDAYAEFESGVVFEGVKVAGAAADVYAWRGHQVFGAGEEILFGTEGVGFVCASGYLLTGP